MPGKEIEDDIMNQRVPLCTVCNVPAPPAVPAKKAGKRKKGKKEWEESESDDDHSPPSQYPPGIMKVGQTLYTTLEVLLTHCRTDLQPDITFFGEKLDDNFEKALQEDRDQVDLLLVIGTSLKVAPVSDILCKWTAFEKLVRNSFNIAAHIPHSVPQILINKTPIKHINPDVRLPDYFKGRF